MRYVGLFCFCLVGLIGCSQQNFSPWLSSRGGAPANVSPYARQPHASAGYATIFAFNTTNGAEPLAPLISVDGTLYGTTNGGGANGEGTVFTIGAAGTESVLHSFGSTGDGANPLAGLIDVDGTLYGATRAGGAKDRGAVFSVSAAGAERVLYGGFGSGGRGGNPDGALLEVNGSLYGTAHQGGINVRGIAAGGGTVFSVSATGQQRVLHSFAGGTDGSSPDAGLIDVDGTLYGTTEAGGAKNQGTVFSLSPAGKERVLYSFGGGADGSRPFAALTEVNGTLYGTTVNGGTYGRGTVFSLSATGTERVLHSFGSGSDGAYPEAGLIAMNGTLYGTTLEGGGKSPIEGTIFSVSTAGAERVLHSFGNGTDGFAPAAGLVNVDGTLYGTTEDGGTHDSGTVFKFTP
jgi:uncharacterized repeat protein (TIGR03803 family)